MRQVGVKVTHSEIVLVNAVHGFAGRVDALFTWGDGFGKMGILDFKTKKTKEGEKVEAYDEHTLQLGGLCGHALRRGAFAARCRGQLFISSTEPGRLEVVKHDKGKLVAAYEAFCQMCAVWRFRKGYDPRPDVR
jgi:RecB family exonuclease